MSFKIPDTPEELFREGSRQFSHLNKWIPFLFVIFVVLLAVVTSFFVVEPNEVGVIRRFGKYTRTANPGLHWKLPVMIEKLDKVKVTFPFKEEFGFRTLKAGVNTQYSSKSYSDESLMLTGDLNVLDVSWIVQFTIKDPVKLLFNIKDPRETVRDVSESVMRLVIGDNSVSEALTTRRVKINELVAEKIQKTLDHYESGIHIVMVKLQDVEPPRPVQDSFNEVNNANQEKERMINNAQEQRNRIIPQARGQAEKTIREAEAYALARIKRAQGDAAKFTKTWNAYKEAKDVTRRRLYLETLSRVLPRAGRIYISDPQMKAILPLMNLTEGTK